MRLQELFQSTLIFTQNFTSIHIIQMKQFLIFLFSIIALIGKSQTADEILHNYELKNGGAENVANVKTLQYNTVMKLSVMGMTMDIPMSTFVETGKLFRKETAGMFGMPGSYSIITDTAGYYFMPTVPAYGDFPGIEGGLKKMEKNLHEQAKGNLYAMREFEGLFNCKQKGNVVELQGLTTIDKSPCYKLKVTAANGLIAYYYIDKETYMLKQMELSGKQMVEQLGLNGGAMKEMMGGKMDNQKVTIITTQFATIDGIVFPIKQKMQFGANDIEVEHSDIQVNATIDKKWYLINTPQ